MPENKGPSNHDRTKPTDESVRPKPDDSIDASRDVSVDIDGLRLSSGRSVDTLHDSGIAQLDDIRAGLRTETGEPAPADPLIISDLAEIDSEAGSALTLLENTLPESEWGRDSENELALSQIAEAIHTGDYGYAFQLRQDNGISDEAFHLILLPAMTQEMVSESKNGGSIDFPLDILDLANVPEETKRGIVGSPEVQSAIRKGMIALLSVRQFDGAIRMCDRLEGPMDVLRSPEVQMAVQEGLVAALSVGNIDSAMQIRARFWGDLHSPEAQTAVQEGMVALLSEGEIETAGRMYDTLGRPDYVYHSPKFQSAVGNEMSNALRRGDAERIGQIRENFSPSEETVRTVATDGMAYFLKERNVEWFTWTREQFSPPEDAVQSAALDAMAQHLRERDADWPYWMRESFNLPEERVRMVAMETVTHYLQEEDPMTYVNWLGEAFNLPKEAIRSKAVEILPTLLKNGSFDNVDEILSSFHISSDIFPPGTREALYFDESVSLNIRRAAESYAEDADVEDLTARATHRMSPSEHAWFRRNRPELLSTERRKELFATIAERERQTDESIGENLNSMAKYFGADTVLAYANRADMQRHDAMEFYPSIMAFVHGNGLDAEKFGQQILLQVAKDGGTYDEGKAHHRFAAVMRRLESVGIQETLERGRAVPGIPKLTELIDSFEGNAHPASSWKLLKKFYDLVGMLDQQEILDELGSGTVEPRLKSYVEDLAFHPNIDSRAVISFWKDPKAFLEVDDKHGNDALNKVKKPSNYLDVLYLGLTPEGLRDALVEGSLDALQTLPPMTREYRSGVPMANEVDDDDANGLHYAMRVALGNRLLKIPGKSANAKRLFSDVQGFLKDAGMDWNVVWSEQSGPAALKALSSERSKELHALLFDRQVGIRARTETEGYKTYRMTLGKNSDPKMVVAGNDTASCMPFGSGKNNVYMFNPNCGQMVLERKTSDGAWRTMAQSVMTIDAVTTKTAPELITAYTGGEHLKEHVTDQDLAALPVVTCDNIEVAKNLEGGVSGQIRDTYTKFLTEYLSGHAAELGVDPTRVAVGQSSTPKKLDLPSVKNHFIPLAPMSYSDNAHTKAYLIETGLPPLTPEQRAASARAGITPLTTRDTLGVAVLEGKAYHDNATVIENLHGIQNNIIAMEIANAHLDRPNLSFVYRNDQGVPKGYMIAYEGVGNPRSDGTVRPEVYVGDLAADPSAPMAGGRLIRKLLESYVASYGTEKRPFIPIFTNARDQTSFRILKGNLERFSKQTGLILEMDEVYTYERGEDTFHDVRIYVGRTAEDVADQRLRYAQEQA